VAQSSWPSPDTARVVNDSQYERLALSYGPGAGLVGSPALSSLVYGDSTGMQFKVAADRYAVVRGYEWWSGASIFTKVVAANSSGSTRIDLIVLRLSRTTWNVTVEIITGTPGAGVAPNPTQNTGSTGVWELPIGTVTVANNASTITAANVTFIGLYLAGDGRGYIAANTAALPYVPHPFEGQMVPVIATGQEYRRTAAGLWVAPVLSALKTADESVFQSSTMQDDDHLFLTLEPNATYWIDTFLMHYVAGSIIDIKFEQSFPAGATVWDAALGPETGLPNSTAVAQAYWGANLGDTTSPTNAHSLGSSTAPSGVIASWLTTIITTAGTGGVWRVRWAQLASTNTTSSLRAGSCARAFRMA